MLRWNQTNKFWSAATACETSCGCWRLMAVGHTGLQTGQWPWSSFSFCFSRLLVPPCHLYKHTLLFVILNKQMFFLKKVKFSQFNFFIYFLSSVVIKMRLCDICFYLHFAQFKRFWSFWSLGCESRANEHVTDKLTKALNLCIMADLYDVKIIIKHQLHSVKSFCVDF